MTETTPAPRAYRNMFIVASALFIVEWAFYCVHLFRHWQSIDASLRTDASSLAMFAAALWIFLVRERSSGFTMVMLLMVFGAAWQLAIHLF